MKMTRWTSATLAGATLTAAAVIGWQAVASADADDAHQGHRTRGMQERMDSGSPGMAQMHERMMENPDTRRAHESMMQNPHMAEMHETMIDSTSSE